MNERTMYEIKTQQQHPKKHSDNSVDPHVFMTINIINAVVSDLHARVFHWYIGKTITYVRRPLFNFCEKSSVNNYVSINMNIYLLRIAHKLGFCCVHRAYHCVQSWFAIRNFIVNGLNWRMNRKFWCSPWTCRNRVCRIIINFHSKWNQQIVYEI